MKIMVTGGTGQVGEHLRELIPDAAYLSSKDCNLLDMDEVDDALQGVRPDTVVHLAAKVGGIQDNIKFPSDYFQDNVIMNTNLLDSCRRHGVDRFIGVGSTCMYPDSLPKVMYPLAESSIHLGPPAPTNFGYGYAKRCMTVHIDAMNQQYGTRYQYLIPTNLYGPHDKYDGRAHFVGDLLRKIRDSKDGMIHLLGDGTPLRQFMYAGDLALAIQLCITRDVRVSFNIAPDMNVSIMTIAETAIEVCRKGLFIGWSGDTNGQHRKDVSNERMKLFLPDFQFTTLKDGLKKTWEIIR